MSGMGAAWLASAGRWLLATAWALLAPHLSRAPTAGAAQPAAAAARVPSLAAPTARNRSEIRVLDASGSADRDRRDHARRQRLRRRHRPAPQHGRHQPPAPRDIGEAGEPAAATGEHGGNGGVATSIGEPGTVHLGDIGPNTHLTVDVSGGTQIADQSGGDGNQQGMQPSANHPPSHHRHQHGHRHHRRHHHHHHHRHR
jgi:hypothetical protein